MPRPEGLSKRLIAAAAFAANVIIDAAAVFISSRVYRCSPVYVRCVCVTAITFAEYWQPLRRPLTLCSGLVVVVLFTISYKANQPANDRQLPLPSATAAALLLRLSLLLLDNIISIGSTSSTILRATIVCHSGPEPAVQNEQRCPR